MKTLKKLFTVLFATALLTSLIACSGADEEETAYGCGELSNTEWIQTTVNGDEVGGDYWVKFTATKYINGLVTDYEYDVVINESEKTFKLFYGGADMEKEFKYELNDEKTELKIYDLSATGLLADEPLTYKKKD